MRTHLLVVLAIGALCQSAYADLNIEERIRISGFGTVAFALSDDQDADYRANIEQSTGVGSSNNPDGGLDSIFGTQIDVVLTPKLTATAQIISRRLSDYNSTQPYFEWANLKYDVSEQLYLRAGRFVAPTFLVSESRMVGYAQPAVRPVAEVYLLSPISYMNGFDAGYKFLWGDSLVKLRAGIGALNQEINQVNGTLDFTFDIKSIDATIENGGSKFRIGYQNFKMDVKNDALELYDVAMDMLEANGVANASLIHDRMQRLDVPTDFISIGYMYDEGGLFVQTEYARREFDSDFAQSLDGVYFLGGYHFGDISPYFSISKLIHRNQAEFPDLDTSSIDPGLGGLVTAVNAGSEFLIERDAIGAGVRWDISGGFALKAQWDYVMKPKNTVAEFVNYTPEFFSESRDVNIISAALDFTF
ncbi:MAG: hypothetical protein GY938_05595 [Ketobacter sp.]|nr:hypothetical protein [Ketobacter sp.]